MEKKKGKEGKGETHSCASISTTWDNFLKTKFWKKGRNQTQNKFNFNHKRLSHISRGIKVEDKKR